jgi:hypothetical protein
MILKYDFNGCLDEYYFVILVSGMGNDIFITKSISKF